MDGIEGAAAALFPPNDLGAPDWRQTDMAERAMIWIDALPPTQHLLLLTLFVLLELVLSWLLFVGLGRFSRLPVERRTAAIRRWRTSRLYLVQMLGMGIKASLTMIYVSHPAVLTYLGQYAACDRPEDPLRVAVRLDALSAVKP